MLVRHEFARFIWIFLLVAVASLAFGAGRAEAKTGLASWYGQELAGSPTASGEPFDPYGYTAAHKTLPLGTELAVRYGGRSVTVTVNDRGPYGGGRDLDLSQGAAEAIGLTRAGVDYVEYSQVGAGGYDGRNYSYSGRGNGGRNYGHGGRGYGGKAYGHGGRGYGGRDHAKDRSYRVNRGYGGRDHAKDRSYRVDRTSYDAGGGGGNGAYVVQRGDTLSGVAADLGVSVNYLANANAIADPDVLYVGQTIYY